MIQGINRHTDLIPQSTTRASRKASTTSTGSTSTSEDVGFNALFSASATQSASQASSSQAASKTTVKTTETTNNTSAADTTTTTASATAAESTTTTSATSAPQTIEDLMNAWYMKRAQFENEQALQNYQNELQGWQNVARRNAELGIAVPTQPAAPKLAAIEPMPAGWWSVIHS